RKRLLLPMPYYLHVGAFRESPGSRRDLSSFPTRRSSDLPAGRGNLSGNLAEPDPQRQPAAAGARPLPQLAIPDRPEPADRSLAAPGQGGAAGVLRRKRP